MNDKFEYLSDDELNLSKVYNTAFELQNEELQPLIEDLKEKYDRSLQTFSDIDIDEEEKKRMQMFSFISLLSYDVYIKKLLIEKILDNITDKELAEKNKEKAKAKEEKLKKKNQ